jgi:hypothetical protein
MLMSTEAFEYIDRVVYGEREGKPGDTLTELLILAAIALSVLLLSFLCLPLRLKAG